MPEALIASPMQRRNATVMGHLDLVQGIARHYGRLTDEPIDDLLQVGRMGLVRAAEGYDPSRGIPFAAYAKGHIRGAILHYLRDLAPLVRVPARWQELEARWRRAGGHGGNTAGTCPPPTAAERWRLDQSALLKRTVPLESLGDLVARSTTADLQADSGVMEFLSHLEPRCRSAVEAVVLDGLSLRQLAQRWGCSPSSVHRALHRGLAELRSRWLEPSGAPGC